MTYRLLFTVVLGQLEPETAHRLAARALRCALSLPGARRLVARLLAPRDVSLRTRALGLELPSPIGVAAGLDKQATWFRELLAIGFGFVEVGTITAQAQPGNEGPRVFRLPAHRALVNSMGFPNDGAAAAARRLRRRRSGAVGVNVGKTKVVPVDAAGADYRCAVRQLAPHADYLVLNVSSPNTPGLRDMQAVDLLAGLIDDVRAELDRLGRRPPLLVKVGPDLSDADIDAVADLAVEQGLDGIVAVNTTTDPCTIACLTATAGVRFGGVSGPPLKARSLEVLRRLRARCGDALTLVSVGGVETPEDAWERILAGATLVQAQTAFVYGGPLWPSRVNRGLAQLARQSGFESVQQAVGAGVTASDIAQAAGPPRVD